MATSTSFSATARLDARNEFDTTRPDRTPPAKPVWRVRGWPNRSRSHLRLRRLRRITLVQQHQRQQHCALSECSHGATWYSLRLESMRQSSQGCDRPKRCALHRVLSPAQQPGVASSQYNRNQRHWNVPLWRPVHTTENYFTIRADHTLTSAATNSLAPTSGTADATPRRTPSTRRSLAISQAADGVDQRIAHVTPNLLNTAHWLQPSRIRCTNHTQRDSAPSRIPASDSYPAFLSVLSMSAASATSPAASTPSVSIIFHYNSYQVYDDVYWTRGKHALKTGFAFERLQSNQLGTSNPNGQFNFGSWPASSRISPPASTLRWDRRPRRRTCVSPSTAVTLPTTITSSTTSP